MFGLYFLNKTDLQYWKHFLNILLIGELFHLMSLCMILNFPFPTYRDNSSLLNDLGYLIQLWIS